MRSVLQPPEAFESLEIPRKDVPVADGLQYRVYSEDKSFILVTAINAQEAIAICGIKNPIRIERYFPMKSNVLDLVVQAGVSDVSDLHAQPSEVIEDTPAEAVSVSDEISQEPLSNEDVEKMMNSGS